MSDHVPPTRILSMSQVRDLLTIEDAIELQRHAFLAHARGQTFSSPNSWLRLPGDQRGWLKLMSAYDETSGGLGVKLLARFPRNPPGRTLGSLLVLFDDQSGTPLAIMDSVFITAIRTAAGAALGTAALARPEPKSIAMIGTGALAWFSLLSHRHLVPSVDNVRVYSRSVENRESFVKRAEVETEISARSMSSVADAVDGADVIITATNAPEPVLFGHHLSAGQHINAIGIRTEVSPDALAACRVFGDGREETIADGKFSVALAAGAVTEADLGPDLGEVLDGAAGRHDDHDITMFDSSGVAIQDLVCAMHVISAARQADVGTTVDLAGSDVLGF
jgi:ornithine cyclodeaminase/alanine dehydrogenase-like protein (mu-crystallin family)